MSGLIVQDVPVTFLLVQYDPLTTENTNLWPQQWGKDSKSDSSSLLQPLTYTVKKTLLLEQIVTSASFEHLLEFLLIFTIVKAFSFRGATWR